MTRKQLDVERLGQVFTPQHIVELMIGLRQTSGKVLEPSCGDGAFSKFLPDCDAIELDPEVAPAGAIVMDFFELPPHNKYACVIGNPPYVRAQDISPTTRSLLDGTLFDGRTNLALYFIHKGVRHLEDGGELVFIVPREVAKLTAARKLNAWLYERGTITHWIELGDARVFDGAAPNCAIIRYELGNFSRRTHYRTLQTEWEERAFVEMDGQFAFPRSEMSVPLASLFDVKVGAVSGADDIFEHPDGMEFVCSKTIDTGATRKMLYNVQHPCLVPHKERLLARRVRRFDVSNWWMWGRAHYDAPSAPRIYINGRTRRKQPFFLHPCEAYDGSILALFPRVTGMNLKRVVELLNTTVPWGDLGFIVDGRFLFSQRTLQTLVLPSVFNELRVPQLVKEVPPEDGNVAGELRRRSNGV
jgi:adenine-specific DNA-methyltransferase